MTQQTATRNRILAHKAIVQKLIDGGGKNGALDTPEKVAAFDKAQDITFEEHFAYQNAQSRAFASGVLTLEEAQTVYAALGEVWNPDRNGGWAQADLAMKVTVTSLMGQLL